MKSAREWAQELWDVEQSCGMNQPHENEEFIRQIQLDAINTVKQLAATREPEAEFENQFDAQSEINAYVQGFSDCKDSISNAAELNL